MQHVILDKKDATKIVHINPSRQELGDKEAYAAFDAGKHIHARAPKPLPEHWKLDGAVIREKKVSEKVADGIIKLLPSQKLDGENIIEKTQAEKLRDGLITQAQIDTAEVNRLIGEKMAELAKAQAVAALVAEGKLTADGKLKK